MNQYCSESWTKSSLYIRDIYMPVDYVFSIIGIVGNTINIIIFNRAEMKSAINIALKGLAILDLLFLFFHLPVVWYTSLRPNSPDSEMYSYKWTICVWLYSYFFFTIRETGLFLLMMISILRYTAVACPFRVKHWWSTKLVRRTVTASFVIGPIFCIPVFYAFNVQTYTAVLDKSGFVTENASIGTNTTLYVLKPTMGFIFYTFDICFLFLDLVTSVFLAVLCFKLVRALFQAKMLHQKFAVAKGPSNSEKETNRSTIVLMGVLFLFLFAEVPEGILGLLTLFFGQKAWAECYIPLGLLTTGLLTFQSSLTFFWYYTMIGKYRQIAKSLLTCRPKITVSKDYDDWSSNSDKPSEPQRMPMTAKTSVTIQEQC